MNLVAEALSEFTNACLDQHGSKPKRMALPFKVACQLTQLALVTPSATLRLRLTAVVSHFCMCRRARDVPSVRASDIQLLTDGSLSFQVIRTTEDAKKPGGEHLFHTYPPSTFATVPYLPGVLF